MSWSSVGQWVSVPTDHVSGPSRLLHEQLAARAERDPDGLFCRFIGAGDFTAREVQDASLRTAAALQRAGVVPGDRVGILLENRVEFLHILFGVLRAGAIAVPYNTAVRGPMLDHQISLTRPKFVFVEESLLVAVQDVLLAQSEPPTVVRLPGSGAVTALYQACGLGCTTYEEFLRDAASRPAPVPLKPSDPAAIFFSSGTTGLSKGVVWSHNFGVHLGDVAEWMMDYGPDDVLYTCLPMFHVNALFNCIIVAIMYDCRVVVAERFSVSLFWSQVVEHGVTVTSLLGTMAPLLMGRPDDGYEQKHKLRLVQVIPSPANVAEIEARFGVVATEGYGSTDVGTLLAVPYGATRPPGACGVPAPGWRCELVDDDDNPVGPGEVGELVARPLRPFMMCSGYWGMAEATVQSWRNLWFHTGDLLRRDAEGWYYFLDRRTDSIRRSGENISAFEVESVLLKHPDVVEAAVFPVPAELGEDEVMAVLVMRAGCTTIPPDVIAFSTPLLPYFAVPRYIEYRTSLPKTQTEKVQKNVLRDAGVTAATYDRGPSGRKAKTRT